MRKFNNVFLYGILFILLSFLPLSAQQEATFVIRMNGHSYPQDEDLFKKSLQEWFNRAFDTGSLGTLIDSLAREFEVTVNQFNIPDSVQINYLIDQTGVNDFIIQISQDDWYIQAEGFGCSFEITIVDFEVNLGGTSEFSDGQFRIQLAEPELAVPVVTVNTSSDFICTLAAALLHGAITDQIDTLITGLDNSLNTLPTEDLFAFLNPFGFLEVEDPGLIAAAVTSFPMEMRLFTEESTTTEIIQMVIEFDFLLGTTQDSVAFVSIEPQPINGTNLDAGGFSFLYYGLQRGYSWQSDWDESQRVDAAFSVMQANAIGGYRVEPRWNELQIQAYTGAELNPDNVTSESIDTFIANAAYWDTTAFNRVQSILDKGVLRNLKPLMALGVGHEDRMPFTAAGQQIAPASQMWQPVEGYVAVSADEYLYNLKIFAHATVRRFAPYVQVWQIENELNAAGFAAAIPEWWRKGDLWLDDTFRNRVWDILVTAVRTEDPQALITHDLHMLGFMQGLENWVEDMDIVGVNFYPNQLTALPNLGFSIGEYVWAVRRALTGINQAGKPVWVIETGFPGIERDMAPDSLLVAEDIIYFSENRQARYLESAMTTAVENGARGFYYYSLTTPEDTLSDRIDNRFMRYSGLIRRDTDEPKPALAVFSDLYSTYFLPTQIADLPTNVPQNIVLYGNYPNPFNPTTTIRFFLPVAQEVSITLFDLLGREVAVLADDTFSSGTHNIIWDATNFASGVYYYRLQTDGDFVQTRKLILLR